MTQPPNSDVERVAEVLPCPFCGAESVPAMAMNMQGTRYYRQCNNCNMQGPDGKTREERDTAWNQRAALQPSGGDAVWQDIATFDGRRQSVLVWCPGNQCTYAVCYRDGKWQIFGGHNTNLETHAGAPTHWQPMVQPGPLT